jgi:ATPase subunit of ABC transporter with duplicated ATPase domains
MPTPEPDKIIYSMIGVSKQYDRKFVLKDIYLSYFYGAKIGVLGLNGSGKSSLLRILAGVDQPDTGQLEPGHGLKIGYYAQEHENLDVSRSVLENMMSAAPDISATEARKVLGSFLFTGDDVLKPAGVLSGGEKTRLSLATLVVSSANMLLLDEPTNNLDPASREEILGALAHYEGAVVLVSHDEGAVEALNPERVLILPDGVEDIWGRDYADLVALA